jgi:hypothetical protein
MAANFLLVGLSTDGPTNVPYRPRDLRELKALFGGSYVERFYVTPTATSLSMQFAPLVRPLNEVDGRKQYLFAPYLDASYRNVMYFGAIGGSANHTVDLLYRPYLGKPDLITAAQRYFEETGTMPYVVRLGGTVATVSVSGWEFESKYAGGKYNYLGLYVTASALTVFGMEPNYPRKTYSLTTVEALHKSIERDYELGILPMICTTPGTAFMGSGLYWFSGGTNGSFSDADFDDFLTNYTMPISVSHVLLLNEITSGIVQSISNSMLSRAQPRMYFIPALTYFGTGSADHYIVNAEYYVPYRHNMISSFVGEITLTHEGERINRFAAEGAALAFAKTGAFNITNLPVKAESFSPVLSQANLDLLKAAGFMTLMRYIRNDIAVYEGTTTYAENTFLYSSKVAEISAIAYDYCFQFFGMILPEGDQTFMEEELYTRLLNVSYVSIENIRIIKRGEELFVRIEGYLPGEILSISFTIQNK